MRAAIHFEEDASEPLLVLDAISHRFGKVLALDNVSLKLQTGEILCIIGPNGSGKTTLFNIITGQLKPQKGCVRFAGKSISGLSPDRIAHLRIGRKFQTPSIFKDLSALDNLLVAHTAAKSIPKKDRPLQFLKAVRLHGMEDIPAGFLSHGQKQWLELGMLISQSPRLILLDEPTAGMTQAETLETVALIRALCEQTRCACLIVEHDMRFVKAINCRVLVLSAGEIIACGEYDDIRHSPSVKTAYLGTHA
ncbi:ABC transporter ATP-binding protein [Telmatospirillum siberiense]|uniref:ABC transporter ATP-binding protein n=1 Tax=Telmatospirillum siberiense TaxID=382514 RepID=A0A2N3PNU9_9PROT|nr:ABC transporter ATP-binding protein [Telmatospirillum siberiense]PKU22075.1 ABC transporter ATP-binding protein [Telmatospirillum siberiense]